MDPDTQTSDDEHLESIPWSQLMVQTKSDRPLLVYVAAAALVALVVGVAVARGLGRPSAGRTTPVTTILLEEPTQPETISEADLRAPLLTTPTASGPATARAEWFVTDYFTSDGTDNRQAALRKALGWDPPVLTDPSTTYVEWARAWDSLDLGDGQYRVLVAYRAITGLDGSFSRDPVRGVAVNVQLGTDGGTRVVDLPEPVEIPPGPATQGRPEDGPLPDSIVEAAIQLGRVWATDASVVGGEEQEKRWRVVIEAEVASGSWPLVVWVDK